MTIEISSPTPASNANARPLARAQTPQMAADAPVVTFLSLLGAMGLPMADDAKASGAAGEAAVVDATLLTTDPLVLKPGLDDDAIQSESARMPLAAEWWAAAVPTAASVAMPAPAATATTVTTAAAGSPGAGPQRPGLAAASARAGVLASAQQQSSDAALSAPTARPNATSELQQFSALAAAALQDSDAAPVSSRDFMARVEAARVAAEPDTATPQRTASSAVTAASSLGQTVSVFDAAATGLRGGNALRSQDRIQTRMAGAAATQGLVGWGDATPAGTQHGSSAVYAPGALTPAPATAMAERVHYWVSRGIQSASLQLEAFAGGTVDVSIAVKGEDAIVEFRTDQPQARQLLLEAMPQLKELLANEGLMLSGGFVGGSAQQGGQAQDRSGQQTAGSEALVGVPQATQDRAMSPGGVSGGRVDLFV